MDEKIVIALTMEEWELVHRGLVGYKMSLIGMALGTTGKDRDVLKELIGMANGIQDKISEAEKASQSK